MHQILLSVSFPPYVDNFEPMNAVSVPLAPVLNLPVFSFAGSRTEFVTVQSPGLSLPTYPTVLLWLMNISD